MAYPSLDFFIVIAKNKSITKASQELYTSQQNLSAYLKKLEDYYGTDLFTRRPKFELTEFGSILYEKALEIQQIHQDINELKNIYVANQELRLGCRVSHPGDYCNFLPMQNYRAAHHNVKFLFMEYDAFTSLDKLRDGSLDFAFSSAQIDIARDPILLRTVMQENQCFILIHKDLLMLHFPGIYEEKIEKWKNGIKLEELYGVPYTTSAKAKTYYDKENMDKYMADHLLSEFKIGECTSKNAALQMCKAGICYFLSGEPEAESDNFFSFPVTEPKISFKLYCYCNQRILGQAYKKDFWDIIQEAGLRHAGKIVLC